MTAWSCRGPLAWRTREETSCRRWRLSWCTPWWRTPSFSCSCSWSARWCLWFSRWTACLSARCTAPAPIRNWFGSPRHFTPPLHLRSRFLPLRLPHCPGPIRFLLHLDRLRHLSHQHHHLPKPGSCLDLGLPLLHQKLLHRLPSSRLLDRS